MESAFGVDHGSYVSKIYEEQRLATPEEAKQVRQIKRPGRIKRTLMPKAAKRQDRLAKAPIYAIKTDEFSPGDKPAIVRGGGRGKNVKRFSDYVGGP